MANGADGVGGRGSGGSVGSQLETMGLQVHPYGAQGCPRQSKGTPKRSHTGTFFCKKIDMLFATRESDGPGRWPPGAPAFQNASQDAAKSDPRCFENIKNKLPRVHRRHQMALTLASRKRAETKDTHPFETQLDKSKNLAMLHVMQVLLGCFPI